MRLRPFGSVTPFDRVVGLVARAYGYSGYNEETNYDECNEKGEFLVSAEFADGAAWLV
jgi:hypothetical protein